MLVRSGTLTWHRMPCVVRVPASRSKQRAICFGIDAAGILVFQTLERDVMPLVELPPGSLAVEVVQPRVLSVSQSHARSHLGHEIFEQQAHAMCRVVPPAAASRCCKVLRDSQ